MTVLVTNVRFEHHDSKSLMTNESNPRISWSFEGDAKGWIQSRYEIEILRDTSSQPEVTTIVSSESILVPWPVRSLNERERAQVRVRAAQMGQDELLDVWTTWSQSAAIEKGLDAQSWELCRLIESPVDERQAKIHRPVLFRRSFHVHEGTIFSRARLYVTAHGIYEAQINGTIVGDQVLAPGWTNYDYQLQYQAFDVLELIHVGENVIAAHVGEGWYAGRLGFGGGIDEIWGNKLGLQALLVLSPQDGGDDIIIGTDDKWKSSFGPILASGIYDGETYDNRLEPIGWASPDFDDAKWDNVLAKTIDNIGRLTVPTGPPIRRIEEVRSISIRQKENSVIVDFGQNLVGWVKIKVSGGMPGQTVTLKHAEVLQNDGHLATRPLRFAAATDSITLRDAEELIWEPKFTFHGFRYVQVIGWPGKVKTESLTAIVVHSDMTKTGWFSCSNPLITRLHENIVWSMRGNFVGVPTDCPQRDERLGWTGDLQVFSRTANFLYDTTGLLQSWLKDVEFEQNVDGSGIPSLFTPNIYRQMPKAAAAVWGDVVVIVPWMLYLSSGDKKVLESQLSSMEAWLERGIPRNDRMLWNTSSIQQLGDWLDPAAPPSEPGIGRTDSVFVANAHLVYITELLSKIYNILGQMDKHEVYQQAARNLRQEFAEEYISPRGRVVSDSQTSIALAIHFSLFQSNEQVEVAAKRLEEIIRADSRFKIATGFVGTAIIGLALSQTNRHQLFYRMLMHQRNPSWLYPVTMGATTIWERWDSMLPDGSINPGEMTSFNHYALGAVAQWIHMIMVGMSPLEAGWKRIKICPIPGGDVTSVSAAHLSPYGMIKVDWNIKDESFHLIVTIPPNTTAEVALPGDGIETINVGSGTHVFNHPYASVPWPPLPLYRPFVAHDDDQIVPESNTVLINGRD